MKNLIFIDDSPLDHYILKRILNKYKLAYEVSCTANGQEVLNFLAKNRLDEKVLPDIILLDLYMPQFDGWAFLEKMEGLYQHLAKPAVIYILSASIDPKDINYAKRFSCVRSFIFKPITKEVLEKIIQTEVSKTGRGIT